MIQKAAGGKAYLALLAATCAASLAACADFSAALSEPNSRTMSLYSLDQSVKPGMTQGDVVSRIGRPAYTFALGRQQQQVWNYRFALPEGDCTVFQVSFALQSGTVAETGQGYDRYCDGKSEHL